MRTYLVDPTTPAPVRLQIEQALAALLAERVKAESDPRAAVPVGTISGGSEAVVDIDESRGGKTAWRDQPRATYSGRELLGTMEGWQAVVTVRTVTPFGGPLPENWVGPPVPVEVQMRIEALPQLDGIPESERAAVIAAYTKAWQIAEQYGCLVVYELDYKRDGK